MTRDDPLTFEGITQPIIEWALDYGITPEIIIARLERGLSVATAITRPMQVAPGQKLPALQYSARSVPSRLTYDGTTMSLNEWAQHIGISRHTLRNRLYSGWSVERALTQEIQAKRAGVVFNSQALSGTGAGESAQETPEITFSQKADPA